MMMERDVGHAWSSVTLETHGIYSMHLMAWMSISSSQPSDIDILRRMASKARQRLK